MRQSVYLLVASQVLGCIPIGSELMDSNGEPSMEPGTEVVVDSGDTEENQDSGEVDLNEALQLDLDGMPVDDFGTLGMKDWHLIFDGELALTSLPSAKRLRAQLTERLGEARWKG